MSKELEALKRLYEYVEQLQGSFQFRSDLDLLRKSLTPPTSKEVCEELKKFTGDDWYFNNGVFRLENYKLDYIFDRYYFNEIPPHLITLIGRFYENEVKEE